MNSLLQKELRTFFGSLTGYLVIVLFLLVTGLFLWVIPGNFNIPEGKKASLDGLFNLAPWVYLFLIPAITMRMLAEEKRTGTIELLITKPISLARIILTKYLASMVLVFFSLVPTLIYWLSVYKLGNPIGNIDAGATWGSYAGLFLLASAYTAIGLWASSLASNQVVSFLIAVFVSFVFFLGFDFASSAILPFKWQSLLLNLGIQEHYRSISRGVIDSRDLAYYLSLSLVFLFLTLKSISPGKNNWSFKKNLPVLCLILLSFWLVNQRFFRFDLTKDKRFSLTQATKKLLQQQNNILYVEIYLNGELPPEMNGFREAIVDKIEELDAFAPKRIFHQSFDVSSILPSEKKEEFIAQLSYKGIQPVNFNHKTNEGLSVKQIFPGVLVQYGNKSVGIDLLKRNPLLTHEDNIKQSIELLEYEFANALKMLFPEKKQKIAFLQGHGEASSLETGDLRHHLSEHYQLVDLYAEELSGEKEAKLLIVADPKEPFSSADKLFIDQFFMNGGKLMWCIDPVFCSIDSLSRGLSTIAFGRDLNLTDLLFKYGTRLSPVLLQDVVCAQYPVNTAPAGQATQWVPAPFYFAPLAQPSTDHPLSRNLSHVLTEFPSMVEAVGEPNKIKTTAVLTTSAFARIVNTPVEASLRSATMPPDRKLFSQSYLPIGVVAEGEFESLFRNRLTENLGLPTHELKTTIHNNKMVLIADGNVIKNKVRFQGEKASIQALGFDPYSQQTFGNKDFLMNCISYLTDQDGIMELRTRVVQIRMLDKVVLRENKNLIILINIVVPIFLILISGIILQAIRIRKYSKPKK